LTLSFAAMPREKTTTPGGATGGCHLNLPLIAGGAPAIHAERKEHPSSLQGHLGRAACDYAAQLAPDVVQMHAHIEHLFGDAGDGLIELAWNEAGTNEVKKAWHYANTPNDRAQLVVMAGAFGVNAKPGQNVYVGAALRRPGMPKDKRANDGDFFALPALYADLDAAGAPDGAWRTCTARGCPPTCVVVTGTVPSKRAQFWWRLDAPITDPRISRGAIAAITAALGGDPAVVNPARVMRLGAGVAWPPDPPKPSKPGRIVEMTVVRLLHPQRRYSLAEMEAAFPLAAGAASHERILHSTAEAQASGNTTDALIARICAGNGGWHKDVLHLVAHWVGRRWSDGEILATAAQLTLKGYTLEQTTAEMLEMIEGARAKWDQPDQPHVLGQHGDISTKHAGYFRAALMGELARLRAADPAHRLVALGRASSALARFAAAGRLDSVDLQDCLLRAASMAGIAAPSAVAAIAAAMNRTGEDE
jgi:hypothetical protein